MTTRSAWVLDAPAIGLSTACLIHCLALPLFASTMPVLGVVSEWEWLHQLFVLLAIPFTATVLVRSAFTKRGLRFAMLALPSLSLLLAAAFMEELHDHETILTTIGAFFLAAAHLSHAFTSHHSTASKG